MKHLEELFLGVTISTAARPISWLSRKQETENVSSTFFCIWRLKPSSNFCHWSCFRRMSRTSKIRVEVFASCAIKINHPWSNESHTKPKVSKLRANVFCPCCDNKVGFAPNSISKHPFVGKILEGPFKDTLLRRKRKLPSCQLDSYPRPVMSCALCRSVLTQRQ